MSATPAPIRRSRDGCRECRRRHRRCDENKPTCTYCRSVNLRCEYTRQLSWGGRPFKKSRFGKCLDKATSGIRKTSCASAGASTDSVPRTTDDGRHSPRGQFVYVSSSIDWKKQPSDSQKHEGDRHRHGPADLDLASEPLPLTVFNHAQVLTSGPHYQLDIFPDVNISSDQFGILVDYFQHETSKSLSCHEEMQREICSTIVPMAMASQHVMAAMLCVASSHRLSVGLEQTEVNVFKLHAVSARLLQDAISCVTLRQDVFVMALATSLVLCLSNIVSSSSHSEDWGVHLKGTSALIKRLDESRYKFEKSTRVLLRLYTSLTAIAAGRGIPSDVPLYAVQSDSGMQDYIDDLAGFSTSLKPIIDAMQALDRSHGQTQIGSTDRRSHHGPHFPVKESYLDLVTKLNTMLQLRTLQFRPEVADSLSEATKLDFWLLDEAYHHMVLLQLYNRIECADTSLQYSIRLSVKRIISCIGSMNILAQPCPGVATLPPLFEAGCSATAVDDRTEITRLLGHIRACFGMGNVACATEFLRNRWGLPANHNRRQERKTTKAAFLPY